MAFALGITPLRPSVLVLRETFNQPDSINQCWTNTVP